MACPSCLQPGHPIAGNDVIYNIFPGPPAGIFVSRQAASSHNLIAAAKANMIEPNPYLRHVLTQMPMANCPGVIKALLPGKVVWGVRLGKSLKATYQTFNAITPLKSKGTNTPLYLRLMAQQ